MNNENDSQSQFDSQVLSDRHENIPNVLDVRIFLACMYLVEFLNRLGVACSRNASTYYFWRFKEKYCNMQGLFQRNHLQVEKN